MFKQTYTICFPINEMQWTQNNYNNERENVKIHNTNYTIQRDHIIMWFKRGDYRGFLI